MKMRLFICIIIIQMALISCGTTGTQENVTSSVTKSPLDTNNIEEPLKEKTDYEALLKQIANSESGAFINTDEGYLLSVSKESEILRIVHTSEEYIADDVNGKRHYIEIYNYQDNKKIQSFHYEIGDYLNSKGELDFIDINFDDNLDIRVHVSLNTYAGNLYINYLWNDETKTFESNSKLNELANPEIKQKEQLLTSHVESLAYSKYQVFRFEGNDVVIVAAAEYQLEDTINLTWSENISVYDDGDEKILNSYITGDEYNKLDREEIYQNLLKQISTPALTLVP